MSTQLKAILQNLLALVGGFLTLKGIDAGLIGQVSGIALAILSIIWSIKDHAVNGGAILSVVGNIVTFIGGLLVAKGILSNADLSTYSGLIIALATSILDALHINTTTTLNAQITSLKAGSIAAKNGKVGKA